MSDYHKKAEDISLYIVRSPLQLLNCHEASRRYADDSYKILLIVYRQEFDRDLMMKLLEESVWDQVHIVDFRSISTQIQLIWKLLRQIQSIGYCFLGDYTQSINFLLNTRKPCQIIWVDDGVATLQCANLIASGEFFSLTKHFQKKSKVKEWLEVVTHSGCSYLKNVEFFTIYDHIRSYSAALKVCSNDYQFLRERVATLPTRDITYFIGNDLRRYVLSCPDRFEDYIAIISQHYAGREWRYILHRKEDPEYMQEIASKYGFLLEKFDRILEQQFLHQGWYPAEVSTICSSALDTLSLIYQPQLTAFLLNAEDVRPDREIVIRELYCHYEQMNVKMLHI